MKRPDPHGWTAPRGGGYQAKPTRPARESEQIILEATRLTQEIVPYRHAVAALRSWANHTDRLEAAAQVTAILDGYGL